MRALVYQALGKKAVGQRPKPEIAAPTDAIVKIVKTTICGTDLHILKTVQSGKIDPKRLITHRFKFENILKAYDTFRRAAETRALKVLIET